MSNQAHQEVPERQRHGFVTFWLGYLMLNGLASVLTFTYLRKDVEEFLKIELSDQYCQFLIAIGILNAISAFLLFRWKKVGFHGSIVAAILNMYLTVQMGAGIFSGLLSLSQAGILYMVLQIKKNEKSAWEWLQ